MSLFVGNLSNKVTYTQLCEVFEPKGPCVIKPKRKYAFVDYENDADAEAAMKDLQHKDLEGL